MKNLAQAFKPVKQFKKGYSLILTFLFMITGLSLNAQTINYQSVPINSSIKVSGTSNIHDWTMKSEVLNANAAFNFRDGKLNDVTALNFSMKVANLKGKEDLLTTRAHKAMNAAKFTTIAFKLNSATATPLANGQYTIKAIGELEISGTTKVVTLYANALLNSDKSISCSGTHKLKMSEFGVAPPSFMLGALKVKDDVAITYNLKFKN